MEQAKSILERVKEFLRFTIDENSGFELVDTETDGVIVEDTMNPYVFYRIDNTNKESICDKDIVEVKPYKVIVTRYKELN